MMTNEEDRYHLSDPWVRSKIIAAIYRGVMSDFVIKTVGSVS